MTRISSVEQFRQGVDNILSQQARLNETQLQLSTGKRVNRPSDDPSASTQLLKLSTLKSKTEQFNRNIDAARHQLQLQESVLSSVSNVLQRVRELTVQANNATQSDEGRAAIADEIYNRVDELLQYANTKDPMASIFSLASMLAQKPLSRMAKATAIRATKVSACCKFQRNCRWQ